MTRFLPPLFFAFLLVFASTAFGQSPPALKGKVVDHSLGLSLGNAVVSVLNAQDSTLVAFVRSNSDGNFHMDSLANGEYLVLVSYPKYMDLVETFSIQSDSPQFDLGVVDMLLLSRVLEDVVITATNAIVIKGDTLEYDASRLVIQPNSKVEDLLIQLPGIQVDKDGKITAHGETVQKVLVDGEEFFGDDPTLVTKNIRGDMVDKIQVYDKKSDQATFTGIDDGEKTKTINIQLREDSKQGMFGKVDVGGATEDRYQSQAMFNTFKGDQKFSAYGTFGNTGAVGLNWQESEKYGASGNIEMIDGMMYLTSTNSDELDSFSGRYNGQGLPKAASGGLHYDAKWNEKKESINANYKIGMLDVVGDRNTLTQNNLPDGLMETESFQDFDNHMFRQKFDTRYTIDFDSTSNLRVTLEGGLKDSRSEQSFSSSTSNGYGERLNESLRSSNNKADARNFSVQALWNKKLRKTGRTLSLQVSQQVNSEDKEGFLNSENSFFNTSGVIDSTQIVDQRKTSKLNNSVFSSNIAYTEPLSKDWKLAVNYRFSYNRGKSDLRSFDQGLGGQYQQVDSLYSNDFTLNQLANQVGTTLNYNTEKNKINLSLKATGVNYKQVDRFHDNRISRNFINLNPSARWSHNFNKQKSLSFYYYGNTNQPSLSQIQPVRENQDPLNIVEGNPDLDPGFTHSLSANFYSFKVLTGQYISVNFWTNMSTNTIVSNVHTDALGKSTYRYENLKNERPGNINLNFNYGNKFQKWDLHYGISPNLSQNRYFNMINGELNKTVSQNYNFNFTLSKYVEKKYSLRFYGGPSYTKSEASLQKEFSNEGWGLNMNGWGTLYLPWKLELSTDGNYQYTQATQTFDEDFKRFIWNAGVSKKFLKTEELKVTVSANDILNQNVGFERRAFNNTNTQTSYTTIKRYFMLSVIWDFNKMGGGNPH